MLLYRDYCDPGIVRLPANNTHDFGHTGVEATVIQFRTNGWWAVQAGKLAKKVKNSCVKCKLLDQLRMSQIMGQRASL